MYFNLVHAALGIFLLVFKFFCVGNGSNGRNGWGATIVDGLSTLLIADMQPEVFDALNYTVHIDFTSPDGLVDPFETIIRYPLLPSTLHPPSLQLERVAFHEL